MEIRSYPDSNLGEVVKVLGECFEEVIVAYEEKLVSRRSPLVMEVEAREQLRKQAYAVLEEVVKSLRSREATSGEEQEDSLSENIGVSRASGNVHPADSLRAVGAFSEVALSILVDNLPPSKNFSREVATVAVAIHEVFMERITRAALAYASHLLEKARDSHADERQRISRELHDRVAHSIVVAFRSLELHELYVDKNPPKARTKLDLAKKVTQEALELARELSSELRDSSAQEGLEAALSEYLRAAAPSCIEAWVSAKRDESLLAYEVRDELFLVLREGLRNAMMHSEARNIKVEILTNPNQFSAAIEDDGKGFEPTKSVAYPRSGTGLASMKERILLLGGSLNIVSSLKGGTRIEVLVPLPGEQR